MLRTSAEWLKEYPYKILDADGWDRTNYDFSFNKEAITREEFINRIAHSTITVVQTIDICTTCDYNYLYKGLSLLESLRTHTNGFVLHWLCMDDKTYEAVAGLKMENVIPYSLKSLEYADAELLAAKNNPPSQYGDAYSQYCWCLTPYFVNYLLKTLCTPILYCDADIYFFDSAKKIFEAMQEKSVAIHTHRFSGEFDDNNPAGWYNVGVMAFNNDYDGLRMSELWKNWLLKTDHEYYEKYGTCGDQKYLNLFIPTLGRDKVCVFDEDAGIMHLAPWCTHNPENKPPLFYHFSHFRIEGDSWFDNIRGEWNPSAEPNIFPLYQQYFESYKKQSS